MPVIYDEAPFKERVKTNLAKEFQHGAIMSAQDVITGKRDALVEAEPGWHHLRSSAAAIRAHVLDNLDFYVRQFAENAERRGCRVHFARTADEAATIMEQVMRDAGAATCIKAKSLLTEEVGVNEHLEACGMRAIETDCAEVVLQTAGSAPSHIVVPALHFDRASIRDLFRERLGYEGEDDPEEITRFLRSFLRPRFLSERVGVAGCNFAVADSGTCTLVTNEGNGRMVSSFPETLVVFVGIERIVPDLASLDVMTRLLVTSAVGSKLTSSFTLNSGPRLEGEADGPKSVHVVLVDNGRSDILAGPYRDALRCIHCGACMNTCPVYRHITGHAYGSIYPGPIGVVMTPLLEGYERTKKLPNACTLCGACADMCPVRIPLNSLILQHRNNLVDGGYVQGGERIAFEAAGKLLGSRALYGMMAGVGRLGMKAMTGKSGRVGEASNWIPVLKGWTGSRDLDPMKKTFRSQFAERQRSRQDGAGDADASSGVEEGGRR
ncbi:iron-sulfur cluster-binding protein [Gordonibacter sp. An230]|uniref:LutB/LldF family L-lactate oxidation iron-sulfur protein n=1 Tax=Gordonibacter sp. An230 TaxID=1965592 RepID=UPI000B37CEB4|nr:LutB/LldF family L-lactate oxidation iron-sulfur protein [Gordonibacter sp. An230]OUO88904.1 iron-sulfur cluster-binding protein [Gordonibacter sp. An230]